MTIEQLCSHLGIDYDEYLDTMMIEDDDQPYAASQCAMLLYVEED